jgi:hypothetical protein
LLPRIAAEKLDIATTFPLLDARLVAEKSEEPDIDSTHSPCSAAR